MTFSKNGKIPAPPAQTIIFDLGRVLVDVNFNGGFFPLLKKSSQKPNENNAEAFYDNALFRKFNKGRISVKQFYEALNSAFNLRLDFPTFKQQWCNVFSPMPGMEALVKTLSEKYVLGLLSDTDELHWEYCLRHFPFLKLFRRPTLSFKTGHIKPDPVCYQLAAESVDVPVDKCLFVDDRISNVEGAIAAGMNAIHFKGVKHLLREPEIIELL